MTMDLTKIKLMKWPILVEMIDRYADLPNPLNLTIVDSKKHWEGKARRGVVVNKAVHVTQVEVGQTVHFKATAGFTLDHDPQSEEQADESRYRFLKEREILAVEEREEVPA